VEIKEIGEFGLIKLLTENFELDRNRVLLGVGDDAAVLKQDGDKLLLATTDALIEGVHFLLATTTPEELGFKAVSINVSDIAAMGGLPTAALLALALPKEIEVEWVKRLYQGIKRACDLYQVSLVGGDTVASKAGIMLTLTVLGETEPEYLTPRSGARPGDLIGVTGCLGGSAAGLEALSRGLGKELEGVQEAVKRHLEPKARLRAARSLVKTGKVHALNDISDGLVSEIIEIIEASGVGAVLSGPDIPVNQSAVQVARYTGHNPLEWALYGGEEYELVFSFSPGAEREIEAVLAGVDCRFSIIGEILDKKAKRTIRFAEGDVQPLQALGYNHFRN
jgi:thiamine-monophosphate kinase